ncbi:MAG: GNAT family N-acetyltransferase [Austwickia sp.]|jgi:ribosomal protein S18 acetylase RimI-like enzyme|nr:MAG: GNAT family N-acetyltransferase [Austwickia sp.]
MEAQLRTAYEVSPPRVAEAAALGELHVAVWRAAYSGLLLQRHLDALDPAERAEQWRTAAARVDRDGWDGPLRCLVARYAERPVGMICVGAPRDADPPAPVQLWSLNVASAHHGRGAAQALMAAALPDGPAYLWVLTGNERAMAFYRKYGFALDGVEQADPAYDAVDLRMTRAGSVPCPH